MKRSWIALSVVCLVCAGVAGAAVHQGETELNFSGSYLSTNGGSPEGSGIAGSGNDSTVWSLNGLFGYFITGNVELAVSTTGEWISYGSGAGEQHRWAYGFGPVAKYYFLPSNTLVPYVGAQAQWLWSDTQGGLRTGAGLGSRDGLMYGPLAGLRVELNARNDFFVEYQYRLYAGELEDVYDSTHAILLGIAHQFR
jgi:hypothetical protein